ncbi:Dabb family protein [Olivibacter sp. CPCC 100613]|uniref:Dabb family protein n=1 Tax=Olivibacter sp. CPCC 100613 TaxID=3079931 RepID=UPI002FF86652
MKRRRFIEKSSGLLAAIAAAPILTQANMNNHSSKNMSTGKQETITHYVLFWLKKGLSEKEVSDFTGFFEELRKVPNIKSLHYGRAANSTPRDVVDNSFTYNLLVYFDTLEDLEVYGTHPIHLKAIEQYSQFWEKVVVHDSVLK